MQHAEKPSPGRRHELVLQPSRLPPGPQRGYPGSYPGRHGHSRTHTQQTHPHPVVREQYCLCAPHTSTERRLLIAVLVLGVLCLALLAGLCAVLPLLPCSGDHCSALQRAGAALWSRRL